MTRVALALTDLEPPAEPAAPPARAAALEHLLARADRSPTAEPTWRHWLLRRAGMSVTAGELPLAGMSLGRRGALAFATPLHLVAGLDHVHLHPAGLLQLTADERTELARDFAAVFGPSDLPFGYVALDGHERALTHDPGPLLGREAGQWLPDGPDGPWLRRFMTEIQMWLHTHPLNDARRARGALAVNCLWIWGLGQQACWPAGKPQAALASDDAALDRVWREAGGITLAGSAESWPGHPDVTASVALSALDVDASRALERADAEYLAPLAAALRTGQLQSLELLIAGQAFRLLPAQRWRFWRRRRPWWEGLT